MVWKAACRIVQFRNVNLHTVDFATFDLSLAIDSIHSGAQQYCDINSQNTKPFMYNSEHDWLPIVGDNVASVHCGTGVLGIY